MPKRKDEDEPRMVQGGTTVTAPKHDYYPEKTQRAEQRALEKDAEELKRQARAHHGGVVRGTYKF